MNEPTTTFSAADLATRTIYRRAVDAVIWGIPAVNFDLMYQSFVRDAKGAVNQIAYWSRIPDWKNQTLTPNPDTLYFMPFFSTKDVGPLVLEIPPADEGSITGTIMHCWQEALEDVGPAGVDKGKGGKYLITPPGFKDKVPEGYLHLPSTNVQGYALLRSILKSRSDADIAKAVSYGKRIKLYPLAQAVPPPRLASASQSQLFDVYVTRLLSQGASVHRYSNAETVRWLSWLAQTTKEWGLAEFQIERLQPTLLRPGTPRMLYRAVVFAGGGAAYMLAGMFANWLAELVPGGAVSAAFHDRLTRFGQNVTWEQRNLISLILVGLVTGMVLASRPRIEPIETLVWSSAKAWREMKRGLRTMAFGGLNYCSFAGFEIGLLAGAIIGWRYVRVDVWGPELTRWGVAAAAATTIVLLALMIAVGVAVKPHAWLVGAIDSRRERWGDATLAGLALGGAAWPGWGVLVAAGAGLAITLILGRSRNFDALSPVRFRNALVTALMVGLGSGAASWWILGISGLVEWLGMFLKGSIAIALATALFGGWLTRRGSANRDPDAHVAGFGWLRGSSGRWLRAAIAGPALGLMVGVVAQSGGRSLAQGAVLLGNMSGTLLTGALALALIFAALIGANGLLIGGFVGALVGLLRGLTGPVVDRRTVPNQGIRASARNVGLFAMIGTALVGLPYAIVNLITQPFWLGIWPDAWDWLDRGLGGSLLFGILAGFVPGAACIQHFSLRFVLWCYGLAPWRYARFLNDATERMFLQRVGGRYRFIHDLLRDHFAAMPGASVKA